MSALADHLAQETKRPVDAGSVPETFEVCGNIHCHSPHQGQDFVTLCCPEVFGAPDMKSGFLRLLKWQHNSSEAPGASPLKHVRQQMSSYDLKIKMKYLINLKSILLGCLSGFFFFF